MHSQNRLRVNDAQLVALSLKARTRPDYAGWVKKKSGGEGMKSPRWQRRWLLLHRNILYYFESDSSQKPQGVIFAEQCDCRSLDNVVAAPSDQFVFSVGIQGVSQRQFLFTTATEEDRDGWTRAIQESSPDYQMQQLAKLREQCEKLSLQLEAKNADASRLSALVTEQSQELSLVKAQLRPGGPLSPYPKRAVVRRMTLEHHYNLGIVIRLQRFWRRVIVQRRFFRLIRNYSASKQADRCRERTRLVWKLVANEEEYVEQLNMLNELFLKPMRMAAESAYPKIKLDKVLDIFSNIEQITAIHELFHSALHKQVERWPSMKIGWLAETTVPSFYLYQEYVRNHRVASRIVREIFDSDSQGIHKPDSITQILLNYSPMSTRDTLLELLVLPTVQLGHYMLLLRSILDLTPSCHIDHPGLEQALQSLTEIQATIESEHSYREKINRTLKVESTIQRGCVELLNPKQQMVRNGILTQQKVFSSGSSLVRKDKKMKARHCFLFTHHLIVTRRISNESVELVREIGVVPLKTCVFEERVSPAELDGDSQLAPLAFRLQCTTANGQFSCIFSCGSPRDKTSWSADINQCINTIEMERMADTPDKITDFAAYMDTLLLSPDLAPSEPLFSPNSAISMCSRPDSIKGFRLYRQSSTTDLRNLHYESVESLCQRLVHPQGVFKDYLDIFLSTMSAFTRPIDVLEFLIKCFHEIHDFRCRRSSISTMGADTVTDSCVSSPSIKGTSSAPRSAIDNERSVLRRERRTEEWGKTVMQSPRSAMAPTLGTKDTSKEAGVPKSLRHRRSALVEAMPSPSIKSFSPFKPTTKRAPSLDHHADPNVGSFISHLPADVLNDDSEAVGDDSQLAAKPGHVLDKGMPLNSPVPSHPLAATALMKQDLSLSSLAGRNPPKPIFAVAQSWSKKNMSRKRMPLEQFAMDFPGIGRDALRNASPSEEGKPGLNLRMPRFLRNRSPLCRKSPAQSSPALDMLDPAFATEDGMRKLRTSSLPPLSAGVARPVRFASEGHMLRDRSLSRGICLSAGLCISPGIRLGADLPPQFFGGVTAAAENVFITEDCSSPSFQDTNPSITTTSPGDAAPTASSAAAAAGGSGSTSSVSRSTVAEVRVSTTATTPSTAVSNKDQAATDTTNLPQTTSMAALTVSLEAKAESLLKSLTPLQIPTPEDPSVFLPGQDQPEEPDASATKASSALSSLDVSDTAGKSALAVKRAEFEDSVEEETLVVPRASDSPQGLLSSDPQHHTAILALLLPSDKIDDDWASGRHTSPPQSPAMTSSSAMMPSSSAMTTSSSAMTLTSSSSSHDIDEKVSSQEGNGASKHNSLQSPESESQQALDQETDSPRDGPNPFLGDGAQGHSPHSLLGDCQSMMITPDSAESKTSKEMMAALSTRALPAASIIFDQDSILGNCSLAGSLMSGDAARGHFTVSPMITTDLKSPWQMTSGRRLSFRSVSQDSRNSAVLDELAYTQPHVHRHTLIRILGILRKWVQNHFQDFACDSHLLQVLVKFMNDLSGRSIIADYEIHSLHVIREMIDRQRNQQIEFRFSTLQTRYLESNDKLSQFLHLDTDTVARQIGFLGFSLLVAIPGRELVNCAFNKEDRKSVAPNVIAVSDFFNQMVNLIMWEILQRKNGTARAVVMEKWVAIGIACLGMNNFYGVTMVTGALASPAVNRLVKTLAHLSKPTKDAIELLNEVTSPHRNHAEMRLRLNECTLPAIPYIGCYQKDLIYLNEVKTCNAEGKVNFSKMKTMHLTLNLIQQFQREPYDVAPDDKVLRYLLNTSHIPREDSLFEVSLRAEPRQN